MQERLQMDDSLEDVRDLLGRLPHDPSVADLLIGPVFRKNLYKEECGPPVSRTGSIAPSHDAAHLIGAVGSGW